MCFDTVVYMYAQMLTFSLVLKLYDYMFIANMSCFTGFETKKTIIVDSGNELLF